uniref:Protein phosphatase 2C 57-like n=1 Tax=Rhizophora mucronata TaxID=61149 RepID=A0A2P2LIR4_RHIMU
MQNRTYYWMIGCTCTQGKGILKTSGIQCGVTRCLPIFLWSKPKLPKQKHEGKGNDINKFMCSFHALLLFTLVRSTQTYKES